MNELRQRFEQERYVVLPGLLSQPMLGQCYQYALEAVHRGAMYLDDIQAMGTPSCYGDPLTEMLMVEARPRIEAICGRRLWPTYSYFRVYKRGDVLAPHRDRPACEISASVNLGYEAEEAWPLWIEGTGGPRGVTLEPGDAVVYRGLECTHWREAFAGQRCAQVFLHYVDRDGPYAEWRFDKRKSLSLVPRRRA
jgi:hypothetical protein